MQHTHVTMVHRPRLAKRMAEEAAAAQKRDPNRTVEAGFTELVCGLLALDPAARLTASAALQLDYLASQQHAITAPLPVDDDDDGMYAGMQTLYTIHYMYACSTKLLKFTTHAVPECTMTILWRYTVLYDASVHC
jgi:hypothetical protein